VIFSYYKGLWQQASPLARATIPWDILRGITHGAVNVLPATLALYIAIEYFDATTLQKSAIAGANFMGLLFSLPYAAWSPVIQHKPLRCAIPMLLSAIALVFAAFATSSMMYTIAIVIFGICWNLPIPTLTSIYRDNYTDLIRGRIFGVTLVFGMMAAIIAQILGGGLLEFTLDRFRHMLVFASLLVLTGAFAILRMPSSSTTDERPGNPLRAIALVREHHEFRYVLIAWFLFGAANLGLMPQRIEYITRPEYGLALGPAAVFLIVGVTVDAFRLLAVQVWAYLFDHFEFIKLRIVMTGFLLAWVLVYFNAESVPQLVAGAALQGCAFGGGSIAWTLWVTKFSPPGQTAQFMAVHTFATGLRGAVAPLFAYWAVDAIGLEATAWVAAALMAISMLMLWHLLHKRRTQSRR